MHERLRDWGLFVDLAELSPAERVVEYRALAPNYRDYAMERRFVWIPEGTQIGYSATEPWAFPVGSVLVQDYAYPADARDPSKAQRHVETRILFHESERDWRPAVYVWDAAGSGARLEPAGEIFDLAWIDAQGQPRETRYSTPNVNECLTCHRLDTNEGEETRLDPLGERSAQLNGEFDYGDGPENQIDHFAALGWLDAVPLPVAERASLVEPFGDAPLGDRARSYMDSNCGHCHADGRFASASNLWLDHSATDPDHGEAVHWGVCKIPTALGGATCGLTFNLVPGDADASIMICRMSSHMPEVRMPPIASKIPHMEAVELISEWINAMLPVDCSPGEGDDS